jgi:hypothetical protein
MNKSLDAWLCRKYPKIFVDRNADMKDTCMCWGFECGDGWHWLIDNLCQCIQDYIDNNPEYATQVVATQVKEKFGGLRFYVEGGSKTIDGMIWLAEHMSENICEDCGSTENVTTEGKSWITTQCDKCRNQKSNKVDIFEEGVIGHS